MTDKPPIVGSFEEDEEEEDARDDGEDSDTRCGVGSFQPEFLQVFARIGAFIGVYSASGLLTSTLVVYINSQVSMLERQFGFSSTETGLLMACNDIGFLSLVIFAGHIAKLVHIPRGLSFSTMLFGICGVLCALPYFIQDKSAYIIPGGETSPSNGTGSGAMARLSLPICIEGSTARRNSTCSLSEIAYDREQLWIKKVAFALLAVGMVFQGIGKSPRYPFVTLYIDNAVDKRKTGFYMGFLTGTGIFGPALAYLLGGFFSKIYVTLEEVPISPKDPRWIGAWWLGFLIFGGVALITSIPIMCFPARFRKRKQEKRAKVLGHALPERKLQVKQSLREESKQFCLSLVRVIKNPVYLIINLSTCLNLMSVSGVISFMPKYLASQYSVPVWKANIILAVSNIMAVSLGSFVGGILTRRIKMTPSTAFKLLLALYAGTITFFGTSFLLGCEQPTIVGGSHDLNTTRGAVSDSVTSSSLVLYRDLENNCATGCGCDDDVYFPVCGDDDRTYFSPCHAGCTKKDGISFTNCSCIAGGTATGGLCEQGCDTNMYSFAVLTFISSIIAALKIIPTFIVKLRCVKSEDRSVSVALSGFTSSAIGWMPGPVIFGIIIDKACSLWKYTCGERQSCYLYDIVMFRNSVVAFGLILKCIAMLVVLLGYVYVRKWEDWPNQQGTVGHKSVKVGENGPELTNGVNSDCKLRMQEKENKT